MLRHVIIFNALCVILVASMFVTKPGPKYPPTKGEVWPKPQQQKKQSTFFTLMPSVFKFTVTKETCQILKTAIERYTTVLRTTQHIAWKHSRKIRKRFEFHNNITDVNYQGHIENLRIELNSPCEQYPHFEMDEKYTLNVSTVSHLTSNSIWGILRGMETFVQLFYISDDYRHVFVNQTDIVDFPRYPHRGLLIDTARHYVSVKNILKTLDAMEMNKMNVLHWHIVDDESFPYESDVFPELSEQGAYDPLMVYTKTNINQIVNYARDRGIRVIPEFDVPGHTRSWGVAYPNLLTTCYQFGKAIGLGPMDPTFNMTYKLIGELFKEVKERFPDKYFHVGGDEVELECWNSNTEIVKFMTSHKMRHPKELHTYFMNLVLPLLEPQSKPIVWQEVFDEGVPLSNDSIIQVWKGGAADEMVEILNAGHKLIFSSAWYLDYIGNGGEWQDLYKADPRQMIPKFLENINRDNILGGEACMWGEKVNDMNIISRVWPRTSAVAEKLWSAEIAHHSFLYPYPPTSVYHRIEEHTCRMNRRGILAQPPSGAGFCVVS